MAKLQRKHGYGSAAARKIVQVSDSMGDRHIAGMQGTTRSIFDAVQLSTASVNQTYTLFLDCKKRAFPLTNLSENKLQKGETMALQRYSLYLLECTTGTTNAIAVLPFAYFTQMWRMYAGWFNFQIGQNQVIKYQPLVRQFAPFNKDATMGMVSQSQTSGAPMGDLISYLWPQDVAWFDNEIVIPENTEFQCQVQIPPVTLPGGNDFYMAMCIDGLGSLLNPKANF